MARPMVRTATVPAGRLVVLRGIFGSAANAFKNLAVAEELTYPVFARAWNGGTVTPTVVQAIARGWTRWTRRVSELGE